MDKKLALYARTSTEKQDTGLEAQILRLEEQCKRDGVTNYQIFADKGISGMKSSRPEFDAMMKAVRAGEIHTVMVYSFSRFARSTQQLINSLTEFDQLKVHFVSYSEKIDTSTPAGKLFFTMVAAFAEFERNVIVERVKSGLHNARKKGKVLGRKKERNDEAILNAHREFPKLSDTELAHLLGISRFKVYRSLKAVRKPS